MKKIFTLLFCLGTIIGVRAQDWNVSDMTAGTYTDDSYVVNGLTIYADDDKSIVIDSNGKELDGVSYTQRLKFGGSARWTDDNTPSARVLAFDVSGNATITVMAMSSSSSASDRYVDVYAGNHLAESLVFGGNVDCCSLLSFSGEYAGGVATTIYVESRSSGINLYRVIAEESGTTDIDDVVITGTIVKTEYYGINGVFVADDVQKLSNGIYIKKVTYDSGQVVTSKVNIIM